MPGNGMYASITVAVKYDCYLTGMKNFKRVLTTFALVSTFLLVLAACQGARTLTDFEIAYASGDDVGEPAPAIVTVSEDADSFRFAGRAHFDDGTIDSVIGALVDWESSDEEVVTINVAGDVTVVGVGAATITGTHKDMTDEVEVVVTPAIAPEAD